MHFTSAAGNASRPPPPCKRRVIKPTAKIPCGLGLGRFISLPTPAPAGPAPELHAQFAPHWRAGQPSCTASLPRRYRPTTVPQTGHSASTGAVPYPETHLRTSPPQPRRWPENLCPGHHENGDESGDRTPNSRDPYSKACLRSLSGIATPKHPPDRNPPLAHNLPHVFKRANPAFNTWTSETAYSSINKPNIRSYTWLTKKW